MTTVEILIQQIGDQQSQHDCDDNDALAYLGNAFMDSVDDCMQDADEDGYGADLTLTCCLEIEMIDSTLCGLTDISFKVENKVNAPPKDFDENEISDAEFLRQTGLEICIGSLNAFKRKLKINLMSMLKKKDLVIKWIIFLILYFYYRINFLI